MEDSQKVYLVGCVRGNAWNLVCAAATLDRAKQIAIEGSIKESCRHVVEIHDPITEKMLTCYGYDDGKLAWEAEQKTIGLAFVFPVKGFTPKCPWANFEPDEPTIAAPAPESK